MAEHEATNEAEEPHNHVALLAPPASAVAIDCPDCRDELARQVRMRLGGAEVEAGPAGEHLECCSLCAAAYIDLLDLTAAVGIQSLLDTWSTPVRSELERRLPAWLPLFRAQVGAARLLDDGAATARALAVVGMLRRVLGEPEEAHLTQQLALSFATAADQAWATCIGHTELALLAHDLGDRPAVRRHLATAVEAARGLWLGDLGDRLAALEARLLPAAVATSDEPESAASRIRELLGVLLMTPPSASPHPSLAYGAGEGTSGGAAEVGATVPVVFHEPTSGEPEVAAVLLNGPFVGPTGMFILACLLPDTSLDGRTVGILWKGVALAQGNIHGNLVDIRAQLVGEALPARWRDVDAGRDLPASEIAVEVR